MKSRQVYFCVETSRRFENLTSALFASAADIFHDCRQMRTIYCFAADYMNEFVNNVNIRETMSHIAINYNKNCLNHIEIRRVSRKIKWPDENEFGALLFGADFAQFFCDLAAFGRNINNANFAEYCKIGRELFGADWHPSALEYCGFRKSANFIDIKAKKMISFAKY